MDFVKASLVFGIAITLYYLLLQWPESTLTERDYAEEAILEKVISDSNDSLTNKLVPMDDPVVLTNQPALLQDKIYKVGNKDLVLDVRADTGQIIGSELTNFKRSLGGGDPLQILGGVGGNLYLVNSGFYTPDTGYLNPNFKNLIEKEGVDGSIIFVLSGESDKLLHERKMTFRSSGYSVTVQDSVTLKEGPEKNVTPYVVIERNAVNETQGGFMNPENFAYLGPVFSTQDDVYEKYSFTDLADSPFRKNSVGGWVALIQHYFLSAWVPDQNEEYKYQGQWGGGSNRFLVGYTAQNWLLGPGKTATTTNTLFVGPKYPGELSKIQQNLDLTVDYGFLFWLGKPMYWVLEQGNAIFKNWGMAIIFLTVIIKLITWPLSAKAYVSMGKMRALQPKLLALQEKYGSDKQKMSQEMMEFYKKEGVNPLGGCLPMLLQMPFFLAFYWVLLETVQLRHSGFLWLDDLSAMDPYFVLPILNGLGMYLSQKMTPTPPNADPMQAQMMKLFPVMFAVIFAWFPSGLVLYWLMNMLIQILQQWWYSRTASVN